MKTFKYFRNSFAVSFLGLIAGFTVGYMYTGTLTGGLASLFLTFILSILETTLSFDNAVVNASILRNMTPLWRNRYLVWGIFIAVFGMRILFPLLVVSVMMQISPWAALVLASTQPDEYARVMMASHVTLSGFGGSFLMMVALNYFFDDGKDNHWIARIERPLAKLGRVPSVQIGLCLLGLYLLSLNLSSEERFALIGAGICGLLVYILVDGVSAFLKMPEQTQKSLEKASAAMFFYVEVQDASFSFDGVIGAFALTNNLFIIAIGLGIGAMFVRSLTLFLVEKKTLEQFAFLEHGAFYAIGALAAIMWLDPFFHIPDVFTGLAGAGIICVSVLDSIRHAKKTSRKKVRA